MIIFKAKLTAISGFLVLNGCGGGDNSQTSQNQTPSPITYSITTNSTNGGSFDPTDIRVEKGKSASFTITTEEGYNLQSVSGCEGDLFNNVFTINNTNESCVLTAQFKLNQYAISWRANEYGTLTPSNQTVTHGGSVVFDISTQAGYGIAEISGCNGVMEGNSYVASNITADCEVIATFDETTLSLNSYPNHEDSTIVVALNLKNSTTSYNQISAIIRSENDVDYTRARSRT